MHQVDNFTSGLFYKISSLTCCLVYIFLGSFVILFLCPFLLFSFLSFLSSNTPHPLFSWCYSFPSCVLIRIQPSTASVLIHLVRLWWLNYVKLMGQRESGSTLPWLTRPCELSLAFGRQTSGCCIYWRMKLKNLVIWKIKCLLRPYHDKTGEG